jgi:hypothetical protein
MKRLAFALVACLLSSSAGVAGSPASKPGACRFQPGQPITATVAIQVHDREVKADSATVNLGTFRIPAGGRMNADGAYVAPPLPTVPVKLAHDTVKHFALIPHIVIAHFDSADCAIGFDSMIGDRSWAGQEKTSFTFDTTITGGTRPSSGPSPSNALINGGAATDYAVHLHDRGNVSCLDQDVPVRLSSGELVPIKDIVAGDWIADPLTGSRLKVAKVTRGTQADERMYRLGYGSNSALFTSQHPILTRRGLVAAADVAAGDELFGEDGAFHKLTIHERRAGDAKRSVYNLRFENAKSPLGDHLLAANGIVTADFDVQNRLAAAKARAGHAVALLDASLPERSHGGALAAK